MENGSIAWEEHAKEAVPRKKVLAAEEEPRMQRRKSDAEGIRTRKTKKREGNEKKGTGPFDGKTSRKLEKGAQRLAACEEDRAREDLDRIGEIKPPRFRRFRPGNPASSCAASKAAAAMKSDSGKRRERNPIPLPPIYNRARKYRVNSFAS